MVSILRDDCKKGYRIGPDGAMSDSSLITDQVPSVPTQHMMSARYIAKLDTLVLCGELDCYRWRVGVGTEWEPSINKVLFVRHLHLFLTAAVVED